MGPRQALGEVRMATAAALIASGALMAASGCTDTSIADSRATTTAEAVTTTTSTVVDECPDSWPISQLDNTGHRFIATGLPEAGTARNSEEGKAAAAKWVELVSADPEVLAGVSQELLDAKVAPVELTNGKCATPAAVSLRAQLEANLATAEVKPGQIPANWTNTGVNNAGTVGAADHAGIIGDRQGINVEFKNGKRFGILKRCANLAIAGPPKIPTGPTDQTPKNDKNITPAGVPGQNRGSGTTDHGPTGPGTDRNHEATVTAPPEQKTPTDNNSNTGTVNAGDAQIGPDQAGNGAPAAPPESKPDEPPVIPKDQDKGNTNPGNV